MKKKKNLNKKGLRNLLPPLNVFFFKLCILFFLSPQHFLSTKAFSNLEDSPKDLKLLTKSRLFLSKGEIERSIKILNELEKKYFPHADIALLKAQALQRRGQWHLALKNVELLEKYYPENEDLSLAKKNLLKEHSPFLKLLGSIERYRRLAAFQHYETTGFLSLNKQRLLFPLYLSFLLKETHGHIRSIIKSDGRKEGFKGEKKQGRISLHREGENGSRFILSGYLSDQRPGLEASYQHYDFSGWNIFRLFWKRPHWELLETFVGEGCQDAIGFERFHRFGKRLSAHLKLGANHYNLRDIPKAASSFLFNCSAYYFFLLDNPTLNMGYSFDGEYIEKKTRKKDSFGKDFFPLPIDTRNFHTIHLEGFYKCRNKLIFRSLIGYSFDQKGKGNASFLISMRYKIKDTLESLMEHSHQLSKNSGQTSDVNKSKASILWYF